MESQSSNIEKSDPWVVLDYEVQMFLGTSYVRSHLQWGNGTNSKIIRNALLESSILHLRILADIFLSRGNRPDDINLQKLGIVLIPLTDIDKNINDLKQVYGKPETHNSNCWIINKMLAHPTAYRSDRYDYAGLLIELDQPLRSVINEIYCSAGRHLPIPPEYVS